MWITCEVISNNCSQYSSKEFELFTKQWEFRLTTTSPLYPQANRLVEKSVQTVKNLLTIAKQGNYDPYLGLLEYRNAPIDKVGSPAQLLMSRRPRSIIPTTEAQLQLRVQDPNKVKEKSRVKQEKQRYYFDQHTKQLAVWKKATDQGTHGKALGTRGGSAPCTNT